MSKQRNAQLQVLKGLRDLKDYIQLLESVLGEAYDSDTISDYLDEKITNLHDESITLGKASLDHSIKGLTNEVNK
jgi:hypothetical protein